MIRHEHRPLSPRWAALLIGMMLSTGSARAAGPLLVTSGGTPYRWSGPVPYNPDRGSLGVLTNAQATSDVAADFAVWEAVPTASVTFRNAGALPVDVDATCPSPTCWSNYLNVCGDSISPIIFDVDGSITDDVLGTGANNSILGFAGPDCGSGGTITEGSAVLNGRFLDGISTSGNREMSRASFNGVFVHEFGHYIDLDHSQMNLVEAFDGTSADDAAIATMFPILFNGVQQATLSLDDEVSVSMLYPEASFASSRGTVTGLVTRADGSAFQGAYVIARKVGDPRLTAVGVASGARYTGSSSTAALRGLYEIPGLPAGDYTIEVEEIEASFTGGSSVGPLDPPATLPGPAEFWNGSGESGADDPAASQVIAVGAAMRVDGLDIVLNDGTAPAPTATLTTGAPTPARTPTPVATAAAPTCPSIPVASCVEAQQASLEWNERTPGRERMKMQWKRLGAATTQGDLGDPVAGTTRVSLCLYDDAETLVRGVTIERAASACGDRPCWQTLGARGYRYTDKLATADGVTRVGYVSGDVGRGRADAAGANNALKGQTALPVGVVAALAAATHPTAQLVTSDGRCFTATMSEVTRRDDGIFKARRR
jgi:hypothetical protein